MLTLSIITINFNDAAGLEKTISSVVAQKFKDYEFIVIDGGSTDGSAEILNKYKDNITFSVSEKDNGIYNAQNKGIDKATGKYCLFLNSGDFLVDQGVLEKVFAQKYTADIVYGDMQIDFGSNITYGKMPDKISFNQMLTDTLWHPVSFIKRELFSKHGGYDESFKITGDYDFFFRTIIMSNVSTQHIPIDISVYNVNGLSSQPEFKSIEKEERIKVLNKYLPHLLVQYLLEKVNDTKPKQPALLKRLINRLK